MLFFPLRHNYILSCPQICLISRSLAHLANWPPASAVIWHVGRWNVSLLKVQLPLRLCSACCRVTPTLPLTSWVGSLSAPKPRGQHMLLDRVGVSRSQALCGENRFYHPHKTGICRNIITCSRSGGQLQGQMKPWDPVVCSSGLPDDATSKKMRHGANPQVTTDCIYRWFQETLHLSSCQ